MFLEHLQAVLRGVLLSAVGKVVRIEEELRISLPRQTTWKTQQPFLKI